MTCRKRRGDVETAGESLTKDEGFGEYNLRTEAASGIKVA